MSLLGKTGVHRSALALATFAAVSMALATPALADHRHYRRHVRHYSGGGHYWHAPVPRVVVGFPLPPVVVVAGPRPVPEYGYERPHDGRYERGYEHGYADGYEDRARETVRRAAHPHSHCDHGCYD